MNREQFLKELRRLLRALPEDEVEQILAYYREMIEDKMESGQSEEEAVSGLGDLRELARKIIGDEDFTHRDGSGRSEFEYKTYTALSDGVSSVILSAENKAVEIVPSDSDGILVKYPDDADQVYEFSCTDGVFRMRNREMRRKSFRFLWHVRCMPAITVQVPRNFAGDLTVQDTNGSVHASEFSNLKSVRLKTANSRVCAENLSARSLELTTSNGAVHLRHVSAGKKISARTTNGKISLDSVQSPEAALKTTNSSIHLSGVSVSGSLLAESTNGKISVDDIESPDISLTTTNSGISGTIRGREEDYTVSSHTANAANNLQNRTGGSKKLSVHTINGRISVSFQN
ncbi:MAG: DUF4097 family beta strand repeat-containing protein [Oscillospiraceae bacterium]|nr:DUF4097 family beta strand repeat-containing protein [Oscillospiraceae bacterium]